MYVWEDKEEDFYELGRESSLALSSKIVRHLALNINISHRSCLKANKLFTEFVLFRLLKLFFKRKFQTE